MTTPDYRRHLRYDICCPQSSIWGSHSSVAQVKAAELIVQWAVAEAVTNHVGAIPVTTGWASQGAFVVDAVTAVVTAIGVIEAPVKTFLRVAKTISNVMGQR